jgi:anti-anti-sigma regulatory factor
VSPSDDDFQVAIKRTTVVHVSGTVTSRDEEGLERILLDLIQNHGIRDLAVDLSATHHVAPGVATVLESVQKLIDDVGGSFLVRTPPEPSTELVEMAEDVSTFVALSSDTEIGRA